MAKLHSQALLQELEGLEADNMARTAVCGMSSRVQSDNGQEHKPLNSMGSVLRAPGAAYWCLEA